MDADNAGNLVGGWAGSQERSTNQQLTMSNAVKH